MNTLHLKPVDKLAEKFSFCWNKKLINSYKSKSCDIVNLLFWGEKVTKQYEGFHNLQGISFLNLLTLKKRTWRYQMGNQNP
jgi:hypothetical protein